MVVERLDSNVRRRSARSVSWRSKAIIWFRWRQYQRWAVGMVKDKMRFRIGVTIVKLSTSGDDLIRLLYIGTISSIYSCGILRETDGDGRAVMSETHEHCVP